MALGLRSTRCRINIRNKNSKLTVFRDQTKICRSSSLDHLTVLSSLFPLFLLILWSFFRPLWLQAQIRNKISMCPSRAQTEFSCYAANQRSPEISLPWGSCLIPQSRWEPVHTRDQTNGPICTDIMHNCTSIRYS